MRSKNELIRLGFIISNYRKTEGLSLEKFANLSKISIRSLREIEHAEKAPNKKHLAEIYYAMQCEETEMKRNTLEIEPLIRSLFKSLFFLDTENIESLYLPLLDKKVLASKLLIYPDYLLVQFAYHVCNNNNYEAQIILDMIEIDGLFSEESLQLFYLYKGVLFKNLGELNQALLYYNDALRLSGNETIQGMVHYHLAIVYTKQLRDIRAYEHNLKAKEYFSRTNNTIRELMIVNHIGIIYSHHREFELAESNFLHLHKQATLLGLDHELSNACHNLVRLYFLWGKEDLTIEYAKKTILLKYCEPSIYFYACWAQINLGNKDEAMKWWYDADKHIEDSNDIGQAISNYLGCLLGLNKLSEVDSLSEINQYCDQLSNFNDRLLFKRLLAKAAETIKDKELELQCYKDIVELLDNPKA